MSTPVLDYQNVKDQKPVLSRMTSRGMAWLMMQMGVSKGIGIAGQIVLTWLLAKEDFGLIALAYATTAYTGLVQKTGLTTILIQRHDRFERWATPAFWLSLVLGFVAAFLIVGSAPLAEMVFHNNKIHGLLLVLALAAPIEALWTVPLAKLQTELRFGYLAKIGVGANILTLGLTLLLAWILAQNGYGAYSFVLPRPIVSSLQAWAYWQAAKVRIRATPQIKRWRYLITDSAILMATSFFGMIIMHSDSVFLGFFHNTTEVGIYYFAFNMSMQTIRFLTGSLADVLFPALSQMKGNAERQTYAFTRAACNLSFVGIPLIVLQGTLAKPFIHVLFHQKWEAAIPVFQVLSLGMSMVLVSGPTQSILQSQGRFRFQLIYTMLSALCFALTVAAGSYWGGVLLVGIVVAAFNFIANPLITYLAIRPQGGGWREMMRIFVRPLVISFAAWGIVALIVYNLSLWYAPLNDDIFQLIIVPLGTIGMYLGLSRLFAAHILTDFISQVGELLSPLHR